MHRTSCPSSPAGSPLYTVLPVGLAGGQLPLSTWTGPDACGASVWFSLMGCWPCASDSLPALCPNLLGLATFITWQESAYHLRVSGFKLSPGY
jgi:hypothetical protein